MGNSFPRKTWADSSGKEPSFVSEARSAALVDSQWTLGPQHPGGQAVWNVVVDPIAGWFTPLWGVDESFLYLRRPEGAWKVALPSELSGEPVLLSIISAKDGLERGPIVLGEAVKGRPGWLGQQAELVLLTDLDRQRSVKGWVGAESADVMGHALCKVVLASSNANRLTIDVYDDASGPPLFRRDGDWLFATDPGTGRVVAYAMAQATGPLAALGQGRLWFHYGGPFLDPFEVQVSV